MNMVLCYIAFDDCGFNDGQVFTRPFAEAAGHIDDFQPAGLQDAGCDRRSPAGLTLSDDWFAAFDLGHGVRESAKKPMVGFGDVA